MPAAAKGKPELFTADGALEQGIELSAWVSIDKNGLVTILSHRAEMGQGAYQAIPQIVAEELEVDLDKVKVAFAPGHQTNGEARSPAEVQLSGAYTATCCVQVQLPVKC